MNKPIHAIIINIHESTGEDLIQILDMCNDELEVQVSGLFKTLRIGVNSIHADYHSHNNIMFDKTLTVFRLKKELQYYDAQFMRVTEEKYLEIKSGGDWKRISYRNDGDS